MDREAWRAAIHGGAKSLTRLSDCTELKDCTNSVLHSTCPESHNEHGSYLQQWLVYLNSVQFSSLQSLSHVRLFVTP